MKFKTYEEIMQDMLSRVDDKYDKRQGSMWWNILAPAGQELAIQYTVLEEMVNTQFLDTSYSDFLTRLCAQFGIDRLPATPAIREVFFNEQIPLGTRFSVVDSDINFRVLEHQGGTHYLLIAEEPGSQGNYVEGSLINIDPLQSYTSATLGRVEILGEDVESDESLRQRTITYIRTPALNGNVSHYEKWASEFPGIGTYIVQPLWNGDNTVRVLISDVTGNVASDDLVEQFQNHLDPSPSGHGLGEAPIGAYVTVASVGVSDIAIVADIIIDSSYELSTIYPLVEATIIRYFETDAITDKEVRNYRLASLIDDITGVLDVNRLLINGAEESFTLLNGNVPKLSGVTLNAE